MSGKNASRSKSDAQKRAERKRRGTGISTFILVAAIIVLVLALWKLVPILMDYHQSESAYQSLSGDIVDLGGDEEADGETEDEPDWASVRIDFDSLKAINKDVVAWIRFDNTDEVNVDYPILHGTSNDEYLHTNLYGDTFSAGSIFLETANSGDLSDRYNIVYGHNMKNGSMFGTLKKYRRDDSFYDDNQYFTVYTPTAAYRYHIFAYEVVQDDDVVYTVGYGADENFQSLIDKIVSRSQKDTGLHPGSNDRIMTLSTCTSATETERFIVCGVCEDEVSY
ncbi:MAG: class B sortase [Clostridiales bacterium]|nr:class B sortase [Clostridiales bacterium]